MGPFTSENSEIIDIILKKLINQMKYISIQYDAPYIIEVNKTFNSMIYR